MYNAKTIVAGIEFHAKSNRKCSFNDRTTGNGTVPPQQLKRKKMLLPHFTAINHRA